MKLLILAILLLLSGCAAVPNSGGFKFGDGSITAAEQAHVDTLPRSDVFGTEWCYQSHTKPFKAKNRGIYHTVITPYPFMAWGKPASPRLVLGNRTNPDATFELYPKHTYPDVWEVCGEGVNGCTIRGAVYWVYGDSNTLWHEMEYHVYRDVKHGF